MPVDYVISQIGNNRVGRSGGAWKTAMPVFSPSLATSISWIFDGDRDAVADMLTDITHVGKKTAIGYGRVLDITFEDTDDPIQRLLPVSDYDVEPMFFARLIPPFWASTEKTLMGHGKLL
jgi:CRISPR type IV-associated protein Csf3